MGQTAASSAPGTHQASLGWVSHSQISVVPPTEHLGGDRSLHLTCSKSLKNKVQGRRDKSLRLCLRTESSLAPEQWPEGASGGARPQTGDQRLREPRATAALGRKQPLGLLPFYLQNRRRAPGRMGLREATRTQPLLTWAAQTHTPASPGESRGCLCRSSPLLSPGQTVFDLLKKKRTESALPLSKCRGPALQTALLSLVSSVSNRDPTRSSLHRARHRPQQ